MPRGRFPRTFWSDERRSRLRELAAAGASSEEIRRDVGARYRQTVTNEAAKLGVKIRRSPPARKPPRVLPDVLPIVRDAVASDPAAAVPEDAMGGAWSLHLAAYLLNVELDFPRSRVARHLGRAPKAIGYGVARIEDRREGDPALDDLLDRLGEQARELAA